MDRLTHAQVGGPYASHDDAERAIERGGFDQSPAELTVQEADSGSKEASVRTGAAVPKADGIDQEPETLEPQGSRDGAPAFEPAPPVDLHGGMEPGEEPGSPGADDGEAGREDDLSELQAESPFPSSTLPMTTKPAQMPSGGGSMLTPPPANPPMPGGVAFDPGGLSAGADPVADGINNIAAVIAQQNPEMDEASVRRVARKVVGRLSAQGVFDPFSMMPRIEDPLAGRPPFDLQRKKQDDSPEDETEDETEESEEPQEGSEEQPEESEPGRQVERAAGGAAGRAMLSRLPMLLV